MLLRSLENTTNTETPAGDLKNILSLDIDGQLQFYWRWALGFRSFALSFRAHRANLPCNSSYTFLQTAFIRRIDA